VKAIPFQDGFVYGGFFFPEGGRRFLWDIRAGGRRRRRFPCRRILRLQRGACRNRQFTGVNAGSFEVFRFTADFEQERGM
jgi:hypothetical protein